MKIIFFSAFIALFSISTNAQVATSDASKNLVPTKKYTSTTIVKQQSTKKHSIKRTVKLIREEKEIPTKS